MLNPRLAALALCSLPLLNGCYFAKSEIIPNEQYSEAVAIPNDQSVGVMLTPDGKFEDEDYPGSGRLLAMRIQEALEGVLPSVVLLETTGLEEALSTSREKGLLFMIRPSIVHWEDRATNWSGLADQIHLELVLINSGDGQILNSLNFTASSSWWAFVNEPPEHMLDDSFDAAVQELLFRSE